jgi:hypothetical protein
MNAADIFAACMLLGAISLVALAIVGVASEPVPTCNDPGCTCTGLAGDETHA